MHQIRTNMEKAESFERKLKIAMPILSEILRINDLHYICNDGRLKSVMNPDFDGDASDIKKLMTDDLFSENTLSEVKKEVPCLLRNPDRKWL